MKYTVTMIDTGEKFREKFRSDPQWVISTPWIRERGPSPQKQSLGRGPTKKKLKNAQEKHS